MSVAAARAVRQATHIRVGCYAADLAFTVIIWTFLRTTATGTQQSMTEAHSAAAQLGKPATVDAIMHDIH
jgi:hypothetical protein